MRVVLVNGIWTDGTGNVDRLKPALENRGIEVVDVDLPVRGPISARWGAKHDALIIGRHSRDDDILVTHSFGGYRAAHAEGLHDYKAIFTIAPAMSKYHEWWRPERVFCYHSTHDRALKVGAALILHPFGRAGLDGFVQNDVRNFDKSAYKLDHGDYFKGDNLIMLVNHIAFVAGK